MAAQDDDLHARARRAVLDLAAERGAAKTFCPSEAARRVDAEDWRRHLTLIRAIAAELVDTDQLQVFRKGKPVDIRTVKGVIRLGMPRAPGPKPGVEPGEGQA